MKKSSIQSVVDAFKAFKTDFDKELVKVQIADARKAEIRASEFVNLKLDENRVIQSAKNYIHNEKAESVEA